jgi:DNA-binding NarL/FixJ family response regulator
MTHIVIVDDHKLFRITLRMALSNTPDVCVSGEADSGASLFNLLHITPCDLVLLDIGLPDMNGVEIARLLRLNHPSLKILAISAENSSDTIRNLLEIGIDGFISKQVGEVSEIIHAIRTIMSGEEYYGKDISTMIYQIYVSKKIASAPSPNLPSAKKRS